MMYIVVLLSCVFTLQAMDIEIISTTTNEGWHKTLLPINDSTSIAGSDIVDLDAYEFTPAAINTEAKPCLILIIPDLPSLHQKQIKKDSIIFVEEYAQHESSKTSFIEFEIEDTVDISKLRDQGLKIATIIKALKEDYTIVILGMGIGGCIAKSVAHNLKYSTKQIALLALIGTPILESHYVDFTVSNTQKVLNLYSTNDETQLASVKFTTLRKMSGLSNEVNMYNVRLQIDGNEPSKEAIYRAVKRLAIIIQTLATYIIHTDLDLNCRMSDEIIHLVIRTEKSYKELSNPKEACAEITASNEDAKSFKQLYGKDIREKSPQVILAVTNILKVGLGYLS